jgi:hypothetical protein
MTKIFFTELARERPDQASRSHRPQVPAARGPQAIERRTCDQRQIDVPRPRNPLISKAQHEALTEDVDCFGGPW